jgi:hypothetical protein
MNLISQIPQNIGPEGPQSSGVPPNGNNAPPSGPQSNNKRKNNPNMAAQLPPGNRPPIKQGPLSGSQSGLGDMDPENVPAQLKKEGSDWFAMYVFIFKITLSSSNSFSRDFDYTYLALTPKYRACLMSSYSIHWIIIGKFFLSTVKSIQFYIQLRMLVLMPYKNFFLISVVCCVKFSGDGKYLATGCNRIAQIYDVQTGQKIW